jgi:hypothetical protein
MVPRSFLGRVVPGIDVEIAVGSVARFGLSDGPLGEISVSATPMKSIEVVLALLAILATGTGIRGDTWDKTQSGWRRLTITGWIAALIAIIVGAVQVGVTIRTQRKEEQREALRMRMRALEFAELGRITEALRLHLVYLPMLIQDRYGIETNVSATSSYLVITQGEAAGAGRWGLLRSEFARAAFRREVRLTEISYEKRPLPETLSAFLKEWRSQLDPFLQSATNLEPKEVAVVMRLRHHEFFDLVNTSLRNTGSMEGFSQGTKTALLKSDADLAAYLAFVDAAEALQKLVSVARDEPKA